MSLLRQRASRVAEESATASDRLKRVLTERRSLVLWSLELEVRSLQAARPRSALSKPGPATDLFSPTG